MSDHVLFQDLIGYTATILSLASLIPQVYHVWRTKSAKDVSMIGMIMWSNILWHIHGWFKGDTPLRLNTALTIAINSVLAILKNKYSYPKDRLFLSVIPTLTPPSTPMSHSFQNLIRAESVESPMLLKHV